MLELMDLTLSETKGPPRDVQEIGFPEGNAVMEATKKKNRTTRFIVTR
jgi:hypothetical protein